MTPDDPTELAGVAEAPTESVAAWSLEEPDHDVTEPLATPQAITIWGVAAALAAVAVAVGLAVAKLPAPDTNVVKVIERQTISQVIPPSTPARDLDAEFIADMKSGGWIITDREKTIEYAHWYCDGLARGYKAKDMQDVYAQKAPVDDIRAKDWAERVTRVYGCRPGRSS